MKLIHSDGDKVGMKWDDIIIRLEWIFDTDKIVLASEYDGKCNGQAKNAIREAS